MRLAAVALLSAACAPSLLVSSLPSAREVEKVNAEIGGKDGTVVLAGSAVRADEIKFGRETTEWREGQKSRRVPTAALQRIDVTSQAGGAPWVGVLSGIPGTLAGLIIAGAMKSGGDSGATPFLALLGIAGGSIALGALVGAAVGSRTTVEFCERGWFAARIPSATKVFAGPDGRSGVVQFVEDATTLCLDGKPAGGFHRVRFSDGRTGFVVDSSLEEPTPLD